MTRFLRPLLIAALAALVVVTAGCQTAPRRDLDDHLANDLSEALARIAQLESAQPAERSPVETYLGKPMPADAILPHADLPPIFRDVVIYSQSPSATLRDAAHYLSSISGVPIRITQDAAAQAAIPSGANTVATLPLNIEASLASALDEVTIRTGTSWRWTGREALIYLRDIRAFRLHAPPPAISNSGTITNASSTGGTGAGGGGGGSGSGGGGGEGGQSLGSASSISTGNNQTTTVEYKFDVFADTVAAVSDMLSEGSTASASTSTGSIVVRGTAAELASVAAYIDTVNAQLTQQVVIELAVLTLDESDERNFNAQVSILNSTLGGDVASAINGGAVPTIDGGAQLSTTIIRASSPWQGSFAAIDAIASSSRASVRRRNLITTLDNQPTRVQSVVERGYEAGQETILVPDVGAQTTTLIGQQTTGFSLSILPQVIDRETILLQVHGGLSIPLERRRVTNSGAAAELLTTAMDDFIQRARLRVGETLVLTGLDQTDKGLSDDGVGSPRFKLFGGASRQRDARRILVIMLTVRSVG